MELAGSDVYLMWRGGELANIGPAMAGLAGVVPPPLPKESSMKFDKIFLKAVCVMPNLGRP